MQGLPASRVVWIRDVYAERSIVFTTDRRSEKMQHLRLQPMCELCWWLPMQKEQYRITAHSALVDCSHPSAALQQLRTALWKASPDWLQRSFSNPPPGQPVAKEREEDRAGGERESGSAVSAEFVVVLLWPVACDYLRLPVTVVDNSRPLHRESRLQPQKEQQRWLHARHSDGSTAAAVHWTVTQVNP